MNLTGRRLGRKGQSTIEFALIFPFLLFFIYVAVEYGLLFTQAQKVSSLSREAANGVFRDCLSKTGAELDACIGATLIQIQGGGGTGGSILPDFGARGTMIVSVFEPDPDTNNPELVTQVAIGSDAAGHYNAATIDAGILRNQGVLVVSEVVYDYVPSTPLNDLIALSGFPDEIRQTTIY